MSLLNQLKKSSLVIPGLLSLFYLVTHLLNLTILPVFADESIYIRWAQLIIDDPGRYLFFPMNDGKTPLFIWLLVPFQFVFSDQLFAGRFVSVLVGLVQMWAMGYVVKLLGGRQKAQWLAMLLTAIMPFWFFHHRMALIDSLLNLMLTVFLIVSIKHIKQPLSPKAEAFSIPALIKSPKTLLAVVAGLSLGLSLWTKVPAILIAPVAILWSLWAPKRNLRALIITAGYIGVSLSVGAVVFLLLRISPSFSQLFSRGSDFLFPVSEVLQGKWRETLPSSGTYLSYFLNYCNPVFIAIFVGSLFLPKRKLTYHLLFWSAVLFAAPIILMGKNVYARYFFPVMIFITPAVALALEEVIGLIQTKSKNLGLRTALLTFLMLLVGNAVAGMGMFMVYALFQPNSIPFVPSDRVQYLTEWSSGHGIPESVAFIQEQSKTQRIAVATEGFFGTLPDGILLYFHRRPNDNIYIEGIGQPVSTIPQFFRDRSAGFDKKYLLVNSHRMELKLEKEYLVKEYCRPFNAPCLQIWDITHL